MKPVFVKNGTQFLQKLNEMYNKGQDFPASKADADTHSNISILSNHFGKLRLLGSKPRKSKSAENSSHLICYTAALDIGGCLKCMIPQTKQEFDSLINQKSGGNLKRYNFLILSNSSFSDVIQGVSFVEQRLKKDDTSLK